MGRKKRIKQNLKKWWIGYIDFSPYNKIDNYQYVKSTYKNMDNQTIGLLAAMAVKNNLSLTETLDPTYIEDKGNKALWDGYASIYNGNERANSNLFGRVDVQIKGHEKSDFSKTQITDSVDISDMKKYLLDGGVMYFVVYINKNKDSKIYYSAFTPTKIRSLFETSKNKTKRVVFDAFPNDNAEKVSVFRNFYSDCTKQSSFAAIKLPTAKDSFNKELYCDFVAPMPNCNIMHIEQALFDRELYFYVKTNDDILLPLADGPISIVSTNQLVKTDVTINERLFYQSYIRVHTSNKITCRMGSSFTITFDLANKKSPINIRYKETSMLRQYIVDLDFILNVVEYKEFSIGGKKISMQKAMENNDNFDIIKEKEKLRYYKDVQAVLNILNIEGDVNINELSKEDHGRFNQLINVLLRKNSISMPYNTPYKILKMKVASFIILLFAKRIDEKNNLYNVSDFFSSNLTFFYKKNTGAALRTSFYSYLSREDYMQISNIQYNQILDSYKCLKTENNEICDIANYDMLKMIHAYDDGNGSNKKLLQSAKQVALWLLDNQPNNSPIELHQVNYLQIILRERELNIEEQKLLYVIVEHPTLDEMLKVAAYLLMKNQVAAEFHFCNLNKEEQEDFKSFPIYKFWSKST